MKKHVVLGNAHLLTALSMILCLFSSTYSDHQDGKHDHGAMVQRYEDWLKRHGRLYEDREEWNLRFGIYKSNVEFIEFTNSLNLSYQLVDNEFADLQWLFPPHGICRKLLGVLSDSSSRKPENEEVALQAAVAKQPVSVAIDAGGYDFQLYSKGVFSGNCGRTLNHGVAIVGYGVEHGKKYWLVKNSWSSRWGEAGYIKMERGSSDKSGICGIAMEAAYPVK